MRRYAPLILALLAAVLIAPARAQTPATSPEASPETRPYTGLIEGVTRQYTPDPKQAPAENPDGFVLVSVHLFRFDSEEDAAASWHALSANPSAPFASQADEEGMPDLHEEEIDDLGDQAKAIWLSATNPDGQTGYYRMLYVQDGEYLILATAMGGAEEQTHLADAIARAATERDAGTGKVTFSADGTSTGGLWNKLPKTGDKDAQGLTAFADKEIAVP